MKWHDARVEKPSERQSVLVKAQLKWGTFNYYSYDEDYKGPIWYSFEGGYLLVSNYPFYATAEEIEKELDSDD